MKKELYKSWFPKYFFKKHIKNGWKFNYLKKNSITGKSIIGRKYDIHIRKIIRNRKLWNMSHNIISGNFFMEISFLEQRKAFFK